MREAHTSNVVDHTRIGVINFGSLLVPQALCGKPWVGETFQTYK